jgi:hypothetical protein
MNSLRSLWIGLLISFTFISAETTKVAVTNPVPVAVVLGDTLFHNQIPQISGLIMKPLFDKYALDKRLLVTEVDVDAFIKSTSDIRNQKIANLQKDIRETEIFLGKRKMSPPSRKAKEDELNQYRTTLKTLIKARESDAKVSSEMKAYERKMAAKFIEMYKINKSFYKQYGGRVIFQQMGPEPLDAYYLFLKDQEKSGALVLLNPELQKSFWAYFLDNTKHQFYEESSGEKAINTPWWQMEPESKGLKFKL